MIDHAKCEHNKEYNMAQESMKSVQAKNAKEKHPLDIIAERLGCSFISDLRTPKYRELAIQELRKDDFERIDVDQLREAFRYLKDS